MGTAETYGLEFPYDANERLIVVLRAYLDVGRNRDTIALCGYVSSQDRWDQFNSDWRAALKDADDLPFFHMTDFEARKRSPYKDWDEKRRREILERFLSLICGTAMVGVRLAVVKEDFESLSTEQQRRLGGVFIMCASAAMGLLGAWLNANRFTEPIAYAFESGDKGSRLFVKAMDTLIEDSPILRRHVVSVNLEDKRGFPGLQAADIIAYEVCRDLPRFVRNNQRGRRYPYSRLMDSIGHIGYYLNAAGLQSLLREHTPEKYAASNAEFGVRRRRRQQKKRNRR